MFPQHFESKEARNAHVAKHHNQFACSVDGCLRQTLGFTSRLELWKYDEQVHSSQNLEFDKFLTVVKSKDVWSTARNGDIDFMRDFH
jgi:hypothetical protein